MTNLVALYGTAIAFSIVTLLIVAYSVFKRGLSPRHDGELFVGGSSFALLIASIAQFIFNIMLIVVIFKDPRSESVPTTVFNLILNVVLFILMFYAHCDGKESQLRAGVYLTLLIVQINLATIYGPYAK